jgi:hypothetical protein
MDRNILWCSSSNPLHLKGEYSNKRKLSKEDYQLAALTRKRFKNWVQKKGYGSECRGDKSEQLIPGFSMSFHFKCGCDETGLLYRKPFEEIIKEWAAEVPTRKELEVQAEHALRLYQRIKSEEVPRSQTNNKARTARYRKCRQQWLDLIAVHNQSLIQQ